MNNLSRGFFVFATGLLFFAATTLAAPKPRAATGAAKAADHFERTKERIDALFKRRLKPDPLPADLPNPFLLGGGIKRPDGSAPEGPDVAAHPGTPAGESPLKVDDTEALARYVAKLKISGTVLLDGRTHLIINQSPYQEGDFILMDNKDARTYLQVIRITPGELILGLNQAVQTVNLKGR